ncbi:MAG: TrkH family potassium uptake protein, partial [Sphingomonadales bacterium]|nr:TrkH family potassium uptake protein [Sphingomonadales bacterium]
VPVITWVVLPLFAALPYAFSGYFDSFFSAYFEAVSGLTTTGSSTYAAPMLLPEVLRFWRVLTSWMGGLLVVVYTFAIFSHMNIGGLGITRTALPHKEGAETKARLKTTAKIVTPLYLGFTIVVFVVAIISGVPPLKALMLSFDSVSTGGFMAHEVPMLIDTYPYIKGLLIIAMFAGGLCISGLAHVVKGDPGWLFRMRESRIYLRLSGVAILLIMLFEATHRNETGEGVGSLIASALFYATSSMSTTGYSLDYAYVDKGIYMAVLIGTLVMIGGTTGSSSGGLRIMRLIVIFRHARLELKRLSHKHDASPLVYEGKVVDSSTISNLWLVFMLFMGSMALGTLGFTLHGLDILNATAASISSLANAGPSVYLIAHNFPGFESLPMSANFIAISLMIAGRLEVVLLIVMLAKNFWKH